MKKPQKTTEIDYKSACIKAEKIILKRDDIYFVYYLLKCYKVLFHQSLYANVIERKRDR